jgi:flavin-dependent dehydrogenase
MHWIALSNGEVEGMYDVIVIGAGPAGCTAAKTLVEYGLRVLLTEKFKLPRYKSCSGQLIQKTLNLVERYFGESPPHSVTCTPAENRGMIFTNDKGKEYRFEQPGLNVWRSSFDEWLARKAEQSGVELRDETAALSCKEDSETVTVTFKGNSTYSEQAKYVIDCEGVVGTLKRTLIHRKPQLITTYQTYNQGSIELDPHYFYAYLQPSYSQYDAWFNVKDNQLVLGVSVKEGDIAPYYDRFIAYMKEKHGLKINRKIKEDRWLMPHIRPGCEIDYRVGKVLFAGEIAGFLNPMGEGISAGIESGYSAAKAIRQYFGDIEQVEAFYRESTKELHTYMVRQWNFVASIAEPFSEMKVGAV